MPTVVGTAFTANLNADKIFIDMTYLPDPITHKFWLTIQNQSISALYFKIVNNIANWTLTTPSDGKLGSVGAGGTGTFTPVLSRAKPASETTDTGSLKIEAYTDSGYTNKIGEASLNVTVYIEDLEAWTDVIKYDFNDGTAQGWSLTNLSIGSEYSVEAGGYSARLIISTGGDYTCILSRTVTLPNRNKVRVEFYLAGKATYSPGIYNIYVYVGNTPVFAIPFTIAGSGVTVGWLKFTADLSAYKGQTVTLKVQGTISIVAGVTGFLAFDHIVIAGKD